MKHRILTYFFVCVFAMLAWPAQAVIIKVTPMQSNTVTGSVVGVNLDITGLGQDSAPSVGGYDIGLSFDPSILKLKAVYFGDPLLGDQLDLFGLGSLQLMSPQAGMVNLVQISLDLPADLDAMQAQAFTLARIEFDAIGVGTTTLGLQLNALADANGDALSAQLQGGLLGVAGGGSEPGTSVPEPDTAILLLAGLACIGSRVSWRR